MEAEKPKMGPIPAKLARGGATKDRWADVTGTCVADTKWWTTEGMQGTDEGRFEIGTSPRVCSPRLDGGPKKVREFSDSG